MNPVAIEKAKTCFKELITNPNSVHKMLNDNRLKLDKSVLFILEKHFEGNLDLIDFELYSKSVKLAYDLYLKVQEDNKPIHGNFYPELRQRYYDLLNVEPIENSSEPLSDTHIAWMLTELSKDTMSETKKHRWLGFIQGCMSYRGLLIVNDERNATREIFKGK